MKAKDTNGSILLTAVCWGMIIFYFVILGLSLITLCHINDSHNFIMTAAAYFLNIALLIVIFGVMLGTFERVPLPFKIGIITATILYTVINSIAMIWLSVVFGVMAYVIIHLSICFIYLLVVLPMLLVGLKNNK